MIETGHSEVILGWPVFFVIYCPETLSVASLSQLCLLESVAKLSNIFSYNDRRL